MRLYFLCSNSSYDKQQVKQVLANGKKGGFECVGCSYCTGGV